MISLIFCFQFWSQFGQSLFMLGLVLMIFITYFYFSIISFIHVLLHNIVAGVVGKIEKENGVLKKIK